MMRSESSCCSLLHCFWLKTTRSGDFRPISRERLPQFQSLSLIVRLARHMPISQCLMPRRHFVRTLSGFLNVPAFYSTTLSMLAACGLMFGQQPSTEPPADATRQQTQAPAHGWRRVTEPPPNQPARSDPADSRVADSRPPDESQSQGSDTPDSGAGSRLTVKRGTFVTVRVDQALSTDWNREGDAFSATLARPLVIDGVIVAQRGQTVGGR